MLNCLLIESETIVFLRVSTRAPALCDRGLVRSGAGAHTRPGFAGHKLPNENRLCGLYFPQRIATIGFMNSLLAWRRQTGTSREVVRCVYGWRHHKKMELGDNR